MRDKKYILCTKSDEETFSLGAQFASLEFNNICMAGDLGSGKTVFSKGYAHGLGIDEYITSPTFNIINRYEKDNITFYHMDAYRITDEEMLYDIGYEEMFDDNCFVVIEWADNIKNSISDQAIWIDIKKDENDMNIRYFIIHCNQEEMEKLGKIRVC